MMSYFSAKAYFVDTPKNCLNGAVFKDPNQMLKLVDKNILKEICYFFISGINI